MTTDVDDAFERCSTVARVKLRVYPDLFVIPASPLSVALGIRFLVHSMPGSGVGMITERDIQVLLTIVQFYLLTRQQIQRLCFPSDQGSRITRRRLQVLIEAGFINRFTLFVYHPMLGSPSPVYYPSRKGCEFLAAHFDDDKYLACNSQPPQANNILHWIAISDMHIVVQEAIARQSDVKAQGWINEFDIVNKAETKPEKRYRLYTLLREQPRLVAAPDAAFVLEMRGFRKVFYLEQDRATSGDQHIAASKSPGFAVMAEQQLHRRHFPETNLDSFSVLLVTPSINRRNHLAKAFRGKPGAALWKFAAIPDVTPEKLLHEPIWYPVEGEPVPLIKPIARTTNSANTQNMGGPA